MVHSPSLIGYISPTWSTRPPVTGILPAAGSPAAADMPLPAIGLVAPARPRGSFLTWVASPSGGILPDVGAFAATRERLRAAVVPVASAEARVAPAATPLTTVFPVASRVAPEPVQLAQTPPAPAREPATQAENRVGRAADWTGVELRNPGFEMPPPDANRIVGWYFVQHAGPKSYEFALDAEQVREGRQSIRVVNIGPEPYGLVAQRLAIPLLPGKTVRFSGWMRTRGVAGVGAGLTVRIERGGTLLSHDFMLDRLVKGDNDWQQVEIAMPVDAGATHIEIGVMLQGAGSIWFDDARLEFGDPR